MKIAVLGGAGFIGTNLIKQLASNPENAITAVDKDIAYFEDAQKLRLKNVSFIESTMMDQSQLLEILAGQQIVYHLVSTTVPSTSNLKISQELTANIGFSANLLEACVATGVKKVIFISSGGTVYGKNSMEPISEDANTEPISSYGVQKLTIEKLLYLYYYLHGLDYRIIRLANPYGPYQRPNGVLGAVTTFTYRALKGDVIKVYGEGNVIRDYIYIDDAIQAIINIADGNSRFKLFNLGSGSGTSLIQLLETIKDALGIEMHIKFLESRKVDVPVNILNVDRYENEFGKLSLTSLSKGICETAAFMKENYNLK